ncbi:hypothetical protein HNR16_000479 [Pseudoclavibacter chungangensis]|nr:hypothetical protein [Pseudoclavibacter chungangensis]
MDPLLAIEITFTGLLVVALAVIGWLSVVVLVRLFKGQS